MFYCKPCRVGTVGPACRRARNPKELELTHQALGRGQLPSAVVVRNFPNNGGVNNENFPHVAVGPPPPSLDLIDAI